MQATSTTGGTHERVKSRDLSMQAQELTSLVAYFLQSKKALAHGQALASRAHELNSETASIVIEALAHEAKTHWMNDAVVDQLSVCCTSSAAFGLFYDRRNLYIKLAGAVSKSLTQQRTRLLEEARVSLLLVYEVRYMIISNYRNIQGWDSARAERNQSLDAILENLGLQHVPPNLHLMSTGSSLFGSQHSLPGTTVIPEKEILKPESSSASDGKSKWKTLRDFVDEKGIEDALEHMEEERTILDAS